MRRRFLVRGRVQGVGFRQFTATQARELGLSGWVRNLADGRVEAEAQGSSGQLSRFEERLRRGPALARVDAVEISELADRPAAEDFEIRR